MGLTTTLKLCPSDIIVVCDIGKSIQPVRKKKKTINNHPTNKFYKRKNNHVVNNLTDTCLSVKKIHIWDNNFNEIVYANEEGIHKKEIINLLLKSCPKSAPVNIVTNGAETSAILRYMVKNHINPLMFNEIPFEAYDNKKRKPKIKIWYVFDKHNLKKKVGVDSLKEFYSTFPRNRTKYTFTKMHSFLRHDPPAVYMQDRVLTIDLSIIHERKCYSILGNMITTTYRTYTR